MNTDIKSQLSNEDENYDIADLYPSVKNAIKKIADKEGYIHPNINKKMFLSNGGNYCGTLYDVNITGDTVKGNKKEINLFIKQVIPNSDNIELVSVSEIYNKEIFVYTELAKMFTELQDNADIPAEKRFKFAKIYNESNIDAIILENMTKREFKTYGGMEVMELNYAELCVEELAKFHGLTFVIEKKIPEYFESKIKSINQSLRIGEAFKSYANKIYKLTTSKLHPNLKLKVDQWWAKALDDHFNYLQGTMTDVKCLCHGDFKTNNIMYKEVEEKVTDVIMVDYQLVHYGSPILDLIYFICMGSDQKFRKKHLSNLKDHYHVSLQKYLEYFGVRVDDVYPKKMFEKDFECCLDYGLISSITVLPFSFNIEDGHPDFVENESMHLGLKIHDKYYERLQGVFDDFLKCHF